MNRFSIVPMKTEEEIRGKAYVHFKAWHETYAGLIDAEYLNTFTLEKCEMIAHRWQDNILVAKDEENVIGFVGYGKARAETLSNRGEIYSIYVLRDYQGQKVGFQLMEKALNKLSDYSEIELWVLKGNHKAIRFYEKIGFYFDETEQELSLGSARIECRMIYQKHCNGT